MVSPDQVAPGASPKIDPVKDGAKNAAKEALNMAVVTAAPELPPNNLTADPADPYGCNYINAYCADRHRESLSCLWTEDKGRILLANRDFNEGDVLFEEPPLHIVHEPLNDDSKTSSPTTTTVPSNNEFFEKIRAVTQSHSLDYEVLWYWCAFNSLTEDDLKGRMPAKKPKEDGTSATTSSPQLLSPISFDQQKKLLLLYHGEITQPSADIVRLIEDLGLNRSESALEKEHLSSETSASDFQFSLLCERLLQVWILNCFEHSEHPLGYSTYFMSSFMSHSCLPNVVWHYREDSVFVLRARRRVNRGDEICCSYLAEEALLESAVSRRDCLQESKHFLCTCERCSGEGCGKLDLSRGFSCPWCKNGVVFPLANQNLVDAPFGCDSCDKFKFPVDFKKLAAAESELEKTHKTWEGLVEKANKAHGVGQGTIRALSESKISAVLEKANMVFAQGKHWILDKLWAVAQEFYDQSKEYDRAIHYCRLRISFHKHAYPGTNGALAWTRETLGELLFRSARKEGKELRWYEEAISEFDQGATILGIMFGMDHDYYVTIDQKRRRVMKKLIQKRQEQEIRDSADVSNPLSIPNDSQTSYTGAKVD